MTLAARIAVAAREHPDVPVTFHSAVQPGRATLAELWADAQALASALGDLGVDGDDVVAVQVPSWRVGLALHTAVWLRGAVLAPIVPIYGPREVSFILRQSRAAVFVVAGRPGAADLLAALPDLPDLDHRVTVGDALPGVASLDELARAAGSRAVVDADLDDRCLLVHTSGTTADPKGVPHTHRGLLAELDATVALDSGPDVRSLAAFPAGHIAGVLGVLRTLLLATPTVVMDAWDPAAAALLVEDHRITSSVGAPIHLHGLLDAARANGHDLSTLREYMTGAANVSAELIARADREGIAAYRCYGSSEHPTISSGLPTDPIGKRAGTDGRPTSGTEVRLIDADGADVGPGADGEILTRGPERFAGYLDPALDEAAFVDGWFRTGDVGRFDADGYLTVTDRLKDLIIRGGENISSKEVEDILGEHPAVAEVAAVGYPDERYGERVCACVVLAPGAHLDLDGVREHFTRSGAARQKTPERLVLLPELPRTSAGKIQKPMLREQVAERGKGAQ